MLTGILYVSATTSLLVGSVLTFNYLEMADYFYLLGTSLFFIKATISLYNEMKLLQEKSVYTTIQ